LVAAAIIDHPFDKRVQNPLLIHHWLHCYLALMTVPRFFATGFKCQYCQSRKAMLALPSLLQLDMYKQKFDAYWAPG